MRPLMNPGDGDGGFAVMKLRLQLGCIEGGPGYFSAIWRVWRGAWGEIKSRIVLLRRQPTRFAARVLGSSCFCSLVDSTASAQDADKARGDKVCRVPGGSGSRSLPSSGMQDGCCSLWASCFTRCINCKKHDIEMALCVCVFSGCDAFLSIRYTGFDVIILLVVAVSIHDGSTKAPLDRFIGSKRAKQGRGTLRAVNLEQVFSTRMMVLCKDGGFTWTRGGQA
ncbi:hypothetical protein V8C35DRAFT_10128 [Trichoderma chlorosporum]